VFDVLSEYHFHGGLDRFKGFKRFKRFKGFEFKGFGSGFKVCEFVNRTSNP